MFHSCILVRHIVKNSTEPKIVCMFVLRFTVTVTVKIIQSCRNGHTLKIVILRSIITRFVVAVANVYSHDTLQTFMSTRSGRAFAGLVLVKLRFSGISP